MGRGWVQLETFFRGMTSAVVILLMLCSKAHDGLHSPSASVWFGGSCLALFPGSVIKLNGGLGTRLGVV